MTAPQQQAPTQQLALAAVFAAGAVITAQQYQDAQAAITANLTQLVMRMTRKYGVPLTYPARRQFAARLFTDVQYARGLSYRLAEGFMRQSAELAHEPLPMVAPIPQYDPDALVRVLERATEPIEKAVAAKANAVSVPTSIQAPVIDLSDTGASQDIIVHAGRVSITDGSGPPPVVDEPRPSSVRVSGNVQAPRTEVRVIREASTPSARRASAASVTVAEDPKMVARVGERAGAAVARHAHQAGRDVVQRTADAAPDRIGWARVTDSLRPCAFCAMLASRGPVYASQHAASFIGMSMTAYHDHCDCRAELVFRGKPWAGEAAYERFEQLWRESTRRKGGKDALAAFRAALGHGH